MADWEEIKRLAADFQKVQLTSTTQKLSERNCVEIVSWLIEKKLIDLMFTSDGKEYLTPSQLVTDIQNELHSNGGRINLTELAKIIGVDYAHINSHLHEVLKRRKDIHFVLGQLIDSTYITKIAGEINEKLQQQGQINVGELTIFYDVPSDFLQQQVLEKNLGTLIFAQQDKSDPKTFFTENFIARSKAKMRGSLSGITRPTPVISILNQIGVNEKLFFTLFEQVAMYGSLTSKLPGAQYVPNAYSRSQTEWVTNFYRQNSYLEFDALVRIGISDYKTYLKRLFGNDNLLFLSSCVVAKNILDRVEADIDECISSKGYVDLQNSLPSVFTSKDINLIVERLLVGPKQQQVVLIDDLVFSKGFMNKLSNLCEETVRNNANLIVESGKYQQYIVDSQGNQSKTQKYDEAEEKVDKREERRKKASGGKSGGGTQGRETKTKSTKKHIRGGHRNDIEDEPTASQSKRELIIVSSDEVKELIVGLLEEEDVDHLLDQIAQYLLPKLNEQGHQIAAEIFKTKIADQTANRRKTHADHQDKLNELICEIRLFTKGIKLFNGDTQVQLNKYLLKTTCSDILTEILNYISLESGLNTSTDNFNNEQRLKFINELPSEYRVPLQPLVKALSGQNIDDFTSTLETAMSSCSMIVKKIDKKKDRLIVLNYKHKLLEELALCEDLAVVLHLAVLVIFISATQCMLNASGRHVSSILSFLKQFLSEDQFSELTSYYDFVTLMLSNGSEAENAREKLKEKMQTVKNLASEYKLSSHEKTV
ncbi:hypothetical protein ABEB36_002783 [Hypothenemus hampei]|uniref:E3 UFM1-protein ligase 1 homolog n=1 Tax=Hypothenemus hampei TaxID=57062 RepID=A0ABD1F8S4_HYPHA